MISPPVVDNTYKSAKEFPEGTQSSPNQAPERLENPTMISGDTLLPGFVFNVAEIW